MTTTVSSKSTKNQILEAYEELMKKVQEKKTEEPKKVQEQQQKQELTTKAKSLSNEGIVKDIAAIKVSVSSALDKLGEQFVTEYKKFDELQQAIGIEKQNLEDLYQLSANTDSLAVMLLAQKEKREQFDLEMAKLKQELSDKINAEKEKHETEMLEKRALWKKEQSEYAFSLKEELEASKKERKREEEEYQYTLKITRKKDIDQYEEKKQKLEKELKESKLAFEKEFAERKAKIEEAETELIELRKKNEAFPADLEKAVSNAVVAVTEKLALQYKFEKELKEKEVEGELKLKEQTISSLSTKIKDLESSLKELSQKTATAESSVKDIAIKAIESSSKPYFSEKSKESVSKE